MPKTNPLYVTFALLVVVLVCVVTLPLLLLDCALIGAAAVGERAGQHADFLGAIFKNLLKGPL